MNKETRNLLIFLLATFAATRVCYFTILLLGLALGIAMQRTARQPTIPERTEVKL